MTLIMIILAAIAVAMAIPNGCGGDSQSGHGKNSLEELQEMDFATFKAKVLNHQVEAVVLYPADQVMTTVTTDSGQIYKVKYEDLAISATGTPLTEFLANNGVPFTVENSVPSP